MILLNYEPFLNILIAFLKHGSLTTLTRLYRDSSGAWRKTVLVVFLASTTTGAKMVHEVFLVDVVLDGIFPKTDKGCANVTVDGRSGTP